MGKSKKLTESETYRKVVPINLREQLGKSEIKITLKGIEFKHLRVVKGYIEMAIFNIFDNADKFDKETSSKYVRIHLNEALMKLYGLEVKQLDDLKLKKKGNIMTLEKAIKKYIEVRTAKKKPVDGTLLNWNTHSNSALQFFGKDIDIEDLKVLDAENYQLHLAKTLTNNVVNNKMAFITSIFEYFKLHEYLNKNVFKAISYMEAEESEKEPFTDKEINNLTKNCLNQDIKMIIKIGIYSGFRIGEIFNLRVENIDLDNMFIHSKTKDTNTKKHTRIIPIHPELQDSLKEYMTNKKNGDRLVYTNDKRVTRGLQDKVNEYIQTIIKNKKKTFHSTRSAFAKKIEDYNIKDIKILLGHKHKDITVKSYLKSDTNWNRKVTMIEQIDYSNTEISKVQKAINDIHEAA